MITAGNDLIEHKLAYCGNPQSYAFTQANSYHHVNLPCRLAPEFGPVATAEKSAIKAIIFDLDDTLYPELDFVRSGYRAVARKVAATGVCTFAAAFECMRHSFWTAGKTAVFPDLLAAFPALPLRIKDLVHIYRKHNPEIDLFPGCRGFLWNLRKKYRLGLITDGLAAVQRNKVMALRLEGIFEKIIYSWDHGKERQKPHCYSFRLMLDFLQIDAREALFVGDNPRKDGRGARGAGMRYVRVASLAHGAGGHEAGEEAVLGNLLELARILS